VSRTPAGHRLLPHTADVRLSAWGPTREACLDQAVRALAEVFVEVPAGVATARVPVRLPPAFDAELLVALLEEVLFVVDVRGLVPVAARVEVGPDGLRGWFAAVGLGGLEQVGSVPKAIARSDLEFGRDDAGTWRAVVTVDV